MKRLGKVLIEALVFLIALIYLSPVYIMLVNSFKSRSELFENSLALPKKFSFEYYTTAMEKMDFLKAFGNSLFMTLVTIGLLVLLSSMMAWMLVRNDHKLSKIIFMLFVATMLIPFQTLMMPLMQLMGRISNNTFLQIINTRSGLVFMYLGFGASMAVFLFHGFIKSVPISLEEAATLDGCTKGGIFFRIVLPLLKPITVTVIILNVIWIWNDYLLPSLTLTDKALRTIPLSTFYFFGEFTIQWNLAMAGLTLTIIPVILFYIFAQKYIIKGVTDGAVK